MYSSVQNICNSGGSKPWEPKTFVSCTLAAYPVLLVRYLVAKPFHAICSVARLSLGKSADTPKDPPPPPVARYSYSEKVQWMTPLRGPVAPTAKEEADALAIGGLRNTADSVSRLTYSAEFGRGLG